MKSILIKGGTVITMDAHDTIVRGDVLIREGRIVAIGSINENADEIIEADGCAVLPGFVQTHIHLCQTLFRGFADDLSLLDWLKKRVWPMEAAHTASSISASARLGTAELIKGGTTSALTMETVNHTEEVFKVVEASGFRATVGKCMMDHGDEVPTGLREQTQASIDESLRLMKQWHGRADGRIRYCFAPRFALSCTKDLLSQVGALAKTHNVMIHTHASENKNECQIVETATGLRNVTYLDSVGLTGAHAVFAHCVHLDEQEFEILAKTKTHVSHCPSSNLKLGSGIAPVKTLVDRGVSVSLGADGAACNNRLDMFTEMRSMALLQKVLHGPEAIAAKESLRMATIGGATALGQADQIGSLEPEKKADVIVVNLRTLHATPHAGDPISALVYSTEATDVRTVLVDGQVLMRDRQLLTLNESEIIAEAGRESGELIKRAGIKA